ncbi:MAG: hypothetical protein ACOC8H_01325 [bacterium]
MATKKEMLQSKSKGELVALARKAGVKKVKATMRKAEIVETLGKNPKVKKSLL